MISQRPRCKDAAKCQFIWHYRFAYTWFCLSCCGGGDVGKLAGGRWPDARRLVGSMADARRHINTGRAIHASLAAMKYRLRAACVRARVCVCVTLMTQWRVG